MKRLLLTAAVIALTGCSVFHHRQNKSDNPYDKPFYVQFLDNGRALDRQIGRTVEALRANPDSVKLHNDLGQLLVQKGFPKDSAREFERAIKLDSHFYPAWYNLGLVRASMGDVSGAQRAFRQTVHLQKGHAEALFQLGMLAEKSGDNETAIDYYAKALRHNPDLIRVNVNPSIVNSKLIPLALIQNYDVDIARESAVFGVTPPGYAQPNASQPPPTTSPSVVPPPAPIPQTQNPPAVPTVVPKTTT